ncbi:TPA: KAP family P-loop NTPase fold protein, partial [Listeria innocua]
EIDVTYDLLNRDIFTNQLYEIVSNLNSQNRFVISLEGAWGSGKTTILNNLSKKLEGRKDLIILDEFEPWLFTNQEMLLKNMLEELLENSGLGYSSIKIDKFIQQVSNATLTSSKYKFLNVLFSNNDSMGIKNVKNDIEELLSSTGKRVVYIIDNLDRIESENVLLIFNLIMNVLDIKNIIFILSFDRNQITSIMNENGITNEYLKKIIQMNVSVPMFDKEVIADILHVSTKNIIEKFEAENLLLNNWEDSLLVIAKDVKDLRDLKIFLNSVFMPSLKKSDSLSFKDMLILEYIRITNIALYGIINKQKEYFISQDYPFHMQNTKYWIDPDK